MTGRHESFEERVALVHCHETVVRRLRRRVDGAGISIFEASPAALVHDGDRPAGVVIDVDRAGATGWETLDAIMVARWPTTVIVICAGDDVAGAAQAARAGAVTVLEKPVAGAALAEHVVDAARRAPALRHADKERRAAMEALARLTDAEREVLRLIVLGRTSEQIAGQLGVAIPTIDLHRAHLLSKMDVRSVAALVRMDISLGLGGGDEPRGEP